MDYENLVEYYRRINKRLGYEWDTLLETMDDFHKPYLDQIGFEELITDRMAWWDTVTHGS